MANNPVFDPEKALGSGLGKLTRDELLSLVKSLCEIAVAQSDENRFRGGFRPGNINFSADGVTVGPADKAGEDGWTKDELEVFIQCFTEEEEMYRIIFLMLFWLGCRVGELLALTESDIDLEGGTVSISKTYFRRNKTDYITAPKTESSNRKITIPQFLQDEIKQFLDRQYELMPEERIFPITDRAIQKKMKQKTEQAKLKPIRVHDLRHSHIALLIEKGMQPLVIAQRVGHDSVNTTMNIYGHLYPNKQKQVADLLNAEATGELKNNLVDMETEKRFRRAGGWS